MINAMRVLEPRRDATSSCPACLGGGVVEYRVPSPIALMIMVAALLLAWLWDKGEWTFYLLAPVSLALMAMREHGRCFNCGVGLDRSILGRWVRR